MLRVSKNSIQLEQASFFQLSTAMQVLWRPLNGRPGLCMAVWS